MLQEIGYVVLYSFLFGVFATFGYTVFSIAVAAVEVHYYGR